MSEPAGHGGEGKDDANQLKGWAGKSVALLIGMVLLGLIALRLLPKVIKLLLFAVVVGVVIYLVRVGRADPTRKDE